MGKRLEKKIEITIGIEALTFGGMGLGRYNGQVVFVPFTLPGEEVRVNVVERGHDYLVGELEDILGSSPLRVEPKCEYFGRCGGCQWQHIDSMEQIVQKRDLIIEAFKRIGRMDIDVVNEGIPSPSQFYYRHRMQYNINHKGKRPHIGLYKRNTHNLVDIYECSIAHPAVNKTLKILWDWAETINDKHIQGVDITCDLKGEKVILVLRYMKGPLEEKKRDFFVLKRLCPEIKGALIRIEEQGKAHSESEGEADLEISYNDYKYVIGPETFIQVNLSGNEILIKKVLQALPAKISRILELHCGMGNFSIPMSRLAQSLVGVESSPESYRFAQINAHYNRRMNCNFIKKSDIKALKQLIRSGMDFSVLVLDPPRSGSKEIIDMIVSMGVPKIVYVSCNPSTLARDVAALVKDKGYILEYVQPIDMFPQTYHIESVSVLRKN